MKCIHCGKETDPQNDICTECRENVGRVEVLSPDEREEFQGLTINDEFDQAQNDEYEYHSTGPNHRVYVRQIKLGNSPFGLLAKLIMGVIGLMLLVVAMPLALLFIGVFLLGWLLNGFKRR